MKGRRLPFCGGWGTCFHCLSCSGMSERERGGKAEVERDSSRFLHAEPSATAGRKRKCARAWAGRPLPLAGGAVSRRGRSRERKREPGSCLRGGRRAEPAEPGGVGAGAAAERQGGAAADPGRCAQRSLALPIQGGIVCPGVPEPIPEARRAASAGKTPFPLLQAASTEQRAEWKPSPSMTSKPRRTTS